MQFRVLVDEFLAHCRLEQRLAANSVKAYTCDLAHFAKFSIRVEKCDRFGLAMLKSYLSHMLGNEGLSTATAKRRMACLRRFFEYAEKQCGWESPFRDWSPSLKRPKRLPRALSLQEMRSLVSVTGGLTYTEWETNFCVLLLGATGLRVSELCAIQVTDISPDGSTIQITGKGSRDRVVFVANKKLRGDVRMRREQRVRLGGPLAPLLVNSRGTRLQPQTLRRRLHHLREMRRVERKVTPHMLRHTAATILIERGTDIRFVQRLLGHASIATTEIYTHVTDLSLKHALVKADAMGWVTGER